jgi:hypothetical protein
MVSCRERGIEMAILRLSCCAVSLGLLILSAGCGLRPRSVEHAEVTGKVLYQGKPLPGGTVSFVAVNGAFAFTGAIDENGQYEVKAPVGEVMIGVDNRMLRSGPTQGDGSKEVKTLRQKMEGEDQKDQPSKGRLKGRYVAIPKSYTDPTTSGLKYTVKLGPQTHDIELSANPASVAQRP